MRCKISISKLSFPLIAILFLCHIGCKRKSITSLTEPLLGMEFVRIPKGSFTMGDHESGNGPDLPHRVKISQDFWLGKTEVTQAQWSGIMGNQEMHPDKPSPFRGLNPEYPVVSVSYLDVERFLEKLNRRSEGFKFRLPTEAEWEYACRAGTKTPFFYGHYLTDAMANYNAEIPSEYSIPGNYPGQPQPVGSYPPNRWGLYDMHGNVWEWVSDWYAPYSNKNVIDPTGPDSGTDKILRGGSWYFGAENARSFNRRKHGPEFWGFSIGFRIICEKVN